MQLLIENAEQVELIRLKTGLLTDEQFWELCAKYPDYDVEISAEGEATIMAPVNAWTGYRNGNSNWQLSTWSNQDGRGFSFDSSSMFTLPSGARRSPDASWIHASRAPQDKEDSWSVCPDFVIELRSRSDRLVNLNAKMHEWIENGAQLAWMIDPKKRTVTVYRPKAGPEVLTAPAYVNGEGPVAGFRLALAKIWST